MNPNADLNGKCFSINQQLRKSRGLEVDDKFLNEKTQSLASASIITVTEPKITGIEEIEAEDRQGKGEAKGKKDLSTSQ